MGIRLNRAALAERTHPEGCGHGHVYPRADGARIREEDGMNSDRHEPKDLDAARAAMRSRMATLYAIGTRQWRVKGDWMVRDSDLGPGWVEMTPRPKNRHGRRAAAAVWSLMDRRSA